MQGRASSQTKGLQRGWKQRARLGRDGFFALASHALRACVACALRAHKTLTPRCSDFFPDFEKKPTVLQSSIDRIILIFFFTASRLSTFFVAIYWRNFEWYWFRGWRVSSVQLQLGHMSDLSTERLGENTGSRWEIALGCSRTCHSRPGRELWTAQMALKTYWGVKHPTSRSLNKLGCAE